MFPRRSRLSRTDFPAALKSGRRFSTAHFSAVVPLQGAGYAVVVPKKVARKSVTRHRIKRRVLAVLRTLPLAELALPPALVLFPRAAVADLPYPDLYGELVALLSKISKAP